MGKNKKPGFQGSGKAYGRSDKARIKKDFKKNFPGGIKGKKKSILSGRSKLMNKVFNWL